MGFVDLLRCSAAHKATEVPFIEIEWKRKVFSGRYLYPSVFFFCFFFILTSSPHYNPCPSVRHFLLFVSYRFFALMKVFAIHLISYELCIFQNIFL